MNIQIHAKDFSLTEALRAHVTRRLAYALNHGQDVVSRTSVRLTDVNGLRGGVDKYGTCQPNYHYEDCLRLFELYQKKDLKNPAAIVDANHSNSNKKYKEQLRIVSEVLHTRRYNPDLKNMIKGVMVESYLEEGRQNIGPDMVYGKSITDPCIGWEDTEHLIYKIAEEC